MHSVYEDERIPLQVRRLMIFTKICRKAKKYSNEKVCLNAETQLAFSVSYSEKTKNYIAYGGVFEYIHTRKEVIRKGIDKLRHDELVMCAITIENQAFTKPMHTPLALLWQWNQYVKNRAYNYANGNLDNFFPVNDELEKDYLPHEYHKHLLAIKNLPLWDDNTLL